MVVKESDSFPAPGALLLVVCFGMALEIPVSERKPRSKRCTGTLDVMTWAGEVSSKE